MLHSVPPSAALGRCSTPAVAGGPQGRAPHGTGRTFSAPRVCREGRRKALSGVTSPGKGSCEPFDTLQSGQGSGPPQKSDPALCHPRSLL